MAFFNWFKKNKKVNVTKRKSGTLPGMAAAAFAEAGEQEMARSMITNPATKTMLVIGRESSFSQELIDYSVNMAKRLGFEIMALNTTDSPLSMPADQRDEASRFFEKSSRNNIASLQEVAELNSVAFSHVVRIGARDQVVDVLHEQCPGVRYVLTEPDQEVARNPAGKTVIPVFALGSLNRAAA